MLVPEFFMTQNDLEEARPIVVFYSLLLVPSPSDGAFQQL